MFNYDTIKISVTHVLAFGSSFIGIKRNKFNTYDAIANLLVVTDDGDSVTNRSLVYALSKTAKKAGTRSCVPAFLAAPVRLELTTHGLTVRCSTD